MNNLEAQLLNQIIWNEAGRAANENFDNDMVEDEDDRGGDGTLDGGVAHNGDDKSDRKSSSEGDLVFFLVCEEALDFAPQHPILRPDVVVSIGLDKSTKLSAVFQRYVDFCNEATTSKERKIVVSDLEFLHCQLLNGHDTAEASALMKNDRIKVRRERTAEREADQERKRIQRDADRNYFQQMRHLMPEMAVSKFADVILDCKGKLSDESGRNQQVLSSTVKAHSILLNKRCPWLKAKISAARIETAKEAEVEAQVEAQQMPEHTDAMEDEKTSIVRRVESDIRSGDEVDYADDDDSAVLSFPPKEKQDHHQASGAAEIEIDEEDEDDNDDESLDNTCVRSIQDDSRPTSPAIVPSEVPLQRRKLPRVTINHSPEAVKLLLEYCYTNRVACLGQEAFVQACKTKPQKHAGPIAPYPISASGSRRWPKNGHPTIPFAVAVAGIALAEEAGLPRLSIMCEVAASQLLTTSNVVEALSLSSSQKAATGNDLPRLRKGVMALIFRHGKRGVSDLERSHSFKRNIFTHRAAIIPMLLQGTLESVAGNEKILAAKRERDDWKLLDFEMVDAEDKFLRDRERKKRRIERNGSDLDRPHELVDYDMEDIYDEFRGWAQEAPKRSLKRMAKHLEAMTAQSMARYSFPRGGGGSSSHRRSSSGRRRSGGK